MNHTVDYDPRAQSYHKLSGVGGEGHEFKGSEGTDVSKIAYVQNYVDISNTIRRRFI
jgi:hypothetical protein